jgi:S1-C subfamily serine protease
MIDDVQKLQIDQEQFRICIDNQREDSHNIWETLKRQKRHLNHQARVNCQYRAEMLEVFHEQDKAMREAVGKLHEGLIDVELVNDAQCDALVSFYNLHREHQEAVLDLYDRINVYDELNLEQRKAIEAIFTYLSNLDVWELQTARTNESYLRVLPSVVSVSGEHYSKRGFFSEIRNGIVGTGFFVSDEYILTNYHITDVITDGTEQVILHNNIVVDVNIVAEDKLNDLALLRIDSNEVGNYDIQPLTFASSFPLIGETIFIVGSPNGFKSSLTVGIFSKFIAAEELEKNCFWSCDICLLDVAIIGGNSGSPVVNADLKATGIISGHFGILSVSIPAFTITKFLKDNDVL